jgi:hypothetical protein
MLAPTTHIESHHTLSVFSEPSRLREIAPVPDAPPYIAYARAAFAASAIHRHVHTAHIGQYNNPNKRVPTP